MDESKRHFESFNELRVNSIKELEKAKNDHLRLKEEFNDCLEYARNVLREKQQNFQTDKSLNSMSLKELIELIVSRTANVSILTPSPYSVQEELDSFFLPINH